VPFLSQITIVGSCSHTYMLLSHHAVKFGILVAQQRRPAARKVTTGLAPHWPWVTDLSGISTYGLKTISKGDKHPTLLFMGFGSLYLYTTERRKDYAFDDRFVCAEQVSGEFGVAA